MVKLNEIFTQIEEETLQVLLSYGDNNKSIVL